MRPRKKRKRTMLLVAGTLGSGIVISCDQFHGTVFVDDGGSDATDAYTLPDVLLGYMDAAPPPADAGPADTVDDAADGESTG